MDGVKLTVNDRIFVHHNTTFQNGAQVNVTGGLTVNNSATVTVTGEDTAVTAKFIALGNSLPGQTNQLVLDSGTLTITGSGEVEIGTFSFASPAFTPIPFPS